MRSKVFAKVTDCFLVVVGFVLFVVSGMKLLRLENFTVIGKV